MAASAVSALPRTHLHHSTVFDGPPRLKARIGDALRGKQFGDFWKYRAGDWRIIADLDDGVMLITVVRLGNRREVYRQ